MSYKDAEHSKYMTSRTKHLAHKEIHVHIVKTKTTKVMSKNDCHCTSHVSSWSVFPLDSFQASPPTLDPLMPEHQVVIDDSIKTIT